MQARLNVGILAGTAVMCMALMGGCDAASAAPRTESLGHFGAWKVYRHRPSPRTVDQACFMILTPDEQKGDFKKRGQPHVMVSRAQGSSQKDADDVVHIAAGYTYLTDTEVVVRVDGRDRFDLFTHNDRAWAKDPAIDRALIKALLRGKKMMVEGVSSRGSATQDVYTLTGSVKAYQALKQACSGPKAVSSQPAHSSSKSDLTSVLKRARTTTQRS